MKHLRNRHSSCFELNRTLTRFFNFTSNWFLSKTIWFSPLNQKINANFVIYEPKIRRKTGPEIRLKSSMAKIKSKTAKIIDFNIPYAFFFSTEMFMESAHIREKWKSTCLFIYIFRCVSFFYSIYGSFSFWMNRPH